MDAVVHRLVWADSQEGGVLVIGFLTGLLLLAEPEYQGRSVREWQQLFVDEALNPKSGEARAMNAFLNMGPEAGIALCELLGPTQPEPVRDYVVLMLHVPSRVRRDMVGCLEPLLGEPFREFQVAGLVLDIAPKQGRLIVPAMVAALENETPHAAELLARVGPDAAPAVPALIAALESSDSELRLQACRALRSVGTKARAAVPSLRLALNDPYYDVAEAAGSALEKIQAAEAATPE
jgi:hypothetical protein